MRQDGGKKKYALGRISPYVSVGHAQMIAVRRARVGSTPTAAMAHT